MAVRYREWLREGADALHDCAGWIRARFVGRPAATLALVLTVALGAWGASGWVIWLGYDATRDLPQRDAIGGIGNMVQATTLYDAYDQPAFTIFTEQRIDVPLSRISPHLIQAMLAIEDQRFYEHHGIDVIRTVAAALANLREGRVAQGGSTITQQLARQSLLTRDKTLRRKFREWVLAGEIERTFSKARILELYLNKVYFGDGLYGAEAASLGYFGKSAADLTIVEAALLAGLVKSPSAYAPTNHLQAATVRRNVVLLSMADAGVITREQAAIFRKEPVALKDALRREESFGLYFKEQVRLELVEQFGWDTVYEGGLRVYTTLDPALQKAAETLTEEALTGIEERKGYRHPTRASVLEKAAGSQQERPRTPYLQAALVALDPATGAVRAMVGGRNFAESHFNRASQARRQPGSAFKPFIYSAAIESGFTPASVIQNLDDPIATAQGEWVPEDEHLESSAMTIRTALRTSSNRAAVQMLQAVGIPRTVEYASRLNVGALPSVPSLALGSGEVTLQSLTGAFAAFADRGNVHKPFLIRKVTDREGKVLYEVKDEPSQAMQESTAFLMANMLADVVNAGTGARARSEGFTLPAAGKTGTTNDFVDAWFVGFTPTLVAGVWVGFDQPQTIIRNGFGGDLAYLWARFMKAATSGDKPAWFTRPENVTALDVCRLSGELPSPNCYHVETVSREGKAVWRSMVATEYFVRGTEPGIQCQLHRASYLEQMPVAARAPEPPPLQVSHPTADLGSPVPPAPAPTTGGVVEAPQPEPEKKRGFCGGRLFGRNKDPEKEAQEKAKKEREAAEKRQRDLERQQDRERQRRPPG